MDKACVPYGFQVMLCLIIGRDCFGLNFILGFSPFEEHADMRRHLNRLFVNGGRLSHLKAVLLND